MVAIDLYYKDYHVKYDWLPEFHPMTWGKLASIFLNSLIRNSKYDVKGSSIAGIYDGLDHVKYDLNALISFPNYQFQRLLSYEEIEKNKERKYYLLIRGPIFRIIEDHSLWDHLVAEYLLGFSPREFSVRLNSYDEMKQGLKDVIALAACSKDMKRIMTADNFWNQFDFPLEREETFTPSVRLTFYIEWIGYGSSGNENNFWDEYQEEHGLTRISVYKLRLMAKKYSKLRVLYGQIPLKEIIEEEKNELTFTNLKRAIASFFPFLQSPQLYDPIQHSIQIINFAPSQPTSSDIPFSKTLMKKLHYLIPTSATNYHFTNDRNSLTSDYYTSNDYLLPSIDGIIRPLFFPYSQLIDFESSPKDSRGRRHFTDDPCTRVEKIRFLFAVQGKSEFVYRRIGDRRLTFLEYDYDPLVLSMTEKDFYTPQKRSSRESPRNSLKAPPPSVWKLMSTKAMAFAFYLEYHPRFPDLFYIQKLQLRDFCYNFLFHDYRCFQSNKFPQPLLIFIGIPWAIFIDSILKDADLLHLQSFEEESLEKITLKIQIALNNVVQEVAMWFRQEFQYYYADFKFQPINIDSCENFLQNGFLSGWNWLFRHVLAAISKIN